MVLLLVLLPFSSGRLEVSVPLFSDRIFFFSTLLFLFVSMTYRWTALTGAPIVHSEVLYRRSGVCGGSLDGFAGLSAWLYEMSVDGIVLSVTERGRCRMHSELEVFVGNANIFEPLP